MGRLSRRSGILRYDDDPSSYGIELAKKLQRLQRHSFAEVFGLSPGHRAADATWQTLEAHGLDVRRLQRLLLSRHTSRTQVRVLQRLVTRYAASHVLSADGYAIAQAVVRSRLAVKQNEEKLGRAIDEIGARRRNDTAHILELLRKTPAARSGPRYGMYSGIEETTAA